MTTCQRPSSSVALRANAAGSGHQASTSASGTGAPSPSSTRPASRTPSGSATGPSSHGSPSARYGPTVWAGVVSLKDGAVPSAEPDVEVVVQRPVLLRAVDRERADHPLARLRVALRLEDRVEVEQRIAGEVH